jgi:hypothetical protein
MESMPIYIAGSSPSVVAAVHRLIAQQHLYVIAIADCERVVPMIARGTIAGILYLDIATCNPSLAAILQAITDNALLLERVAIVLIGDGNLLSSSDQQQIDTLSLPILSFPFTDIEFVNLFNALLPRFP